MLGDNLALSFMPDGDLILPLSKQKENSDEDRGTYQARVLPVTAL